MDDKVNEKPGVLLYTAVTLKACSFVHAKKKKARSTLFSTPSIINSDLYVSEHHRSAHVTVQLMQARISQGRDSG